MKATIKDVTKNGNDLSNPQIDIVVEFEHKDFPADHHYPEGGKRQFIYTLPYEKFSVLDEAELEKMVRAQGVEFAATLEKRVEMETKETDLKSFIGREFDLK